MLKRAKTDISVLYSPNWLKLWEKRFEDPLVDAESFKINHRGIISEIGKKPNKLSEIDGQYMGLLKFTPIGWAEITRIWSGISPKDQDTISMTEILQKVIEAKRVFVVGYPYYGTWGEIDTERDLRMWNE
jgi:choline kinase